MNQSISALNSTRDPQVLLGARTILWRQSRKDQDKAIWNDKLQSIICVRTSAEPATAMERLLWKLHQLTNVFLKVHLKKLRKVILGALIVSNKSETWPWCNGAALAGDRIQSPLPAPYGGLELLWQIVTQTEQSPRTVGGCSMKSAQVQDVSSRASCHLDSRNLLTLDSILHLK